MSSTARSSSHDLASARQIILDTAPDKQSSLPSGLGRAFETVLTASRAQDTRERVSDKTLFLALLEWFKCIHGLHRSSTELYETVLKCICNTVTDSDHNRDLIAKDVPCLNLIRDLICPLSDPDSISSVPTFAASNIAISTIFNICKDHEHARQACMKAHIHKALLYFTVRQTKECSEDTLALAVDLWADLVHQWTTAERLDDLDNEYLSKLIKASQLDIDDQETRADLLLTIAAHLSHADVQALVLRGDCLAQMLDMLDFVAQRKSNTGDETDAKTERLLLSGIVETSIRPEFPSKVHIGDPRYDRLCKAWFIPDSDLTMSSLSVCANVLLANMIIDHATAITMVTQIPLDNLCHSLHERLAAPSKTKSPAEKEYLHAAFGLLRSLAAPQQNRERYFAKPQFRDMVNLALTYPAPEVQLIALQLFRRISTNQYDDPEAQKIASDVFEATSDVQLKLECASIYLGWTKSLLENRKPSARDGTETISYRPHFLHAFAFAATQKSLITAQANGWLGLALYARLPGAPKLISNQLVEQEDFATVLEDALNMKPAAVPTESVTKAEHGVTDTEDEMDPQEAQLPPQFRARVRDNVTILLHSLLTSDGVVGPARQQMQDIAQRAGIRFVNE